MIIHLCLNDPSNGNSTGQLFAIEFDDLLKLESNFIPDPNVVCRMSSRGQEMRIRIGRKTFPIKSYSFWVGNWCWDAIDVTDEIATQIMAHVQSLTLHGRHKFSPDTGLTVLWEKYEKGEKITFPFREKLVN